MKNIDLFVLGESLKENLESLKQLKGAKFTFMITKNIDILENEMKRISSHVNPTEKYKEFENKRIELCVNFCKKDENNNLIYKTIDNSQEYDIDITDSKWIDSINKLKDEYNDSIKIRDKQINDYNKLLDENTDIIFNKINIDDISDDVSLEHMLLLKSFIIEE